jgi:hypothetical protein
MKNFHFKLRDKFSVTAHRFEIGNPLLQPWQFNRNHLFKKIYSLAETDYKPFYDFHLTHFLESNPDCEKDFFSHFDSIVSERIRYYKMQDPFSSRQKSYQSNLTKLESFELFLRSIDQWNLNQSFESIIAGKEIEIQGLKSEIAELKERIKTLKEFEPSEKIQIRINHLGTFVDLIQQMQLLTLPGKNKLLVSQTNSSWYKIVARYFTNGSKDIPLETARNYFSGKYSEENIKGTKIKKDLKLFQINKIEEN